MSPGVMKKIYRIGYTQPGKWRHFKRKSTSLVLTVACCCASQFPEISKVFIQKLEW